MLISLSEPQEAIFSNCRNPSRSASAGGEPARACSFTWPASLHAASHGFTPNLSLHVRLLQEANPASLPAASHGFTCRLLQLPCRLSAFSHAAGGAGEAGLATWVGWYMGNFGFIGLSDEEEAFAINLWNNRFDWLPEDCTPIEGNNFNCSPEYTEWFNNNGKPFLVAHEVSQRWHTEQRCSYQHVGETFEPEQNWHQSPNNGVMDLNIEWSTWESRTEPIRPVVGSSSSSNPWEEPIYNYPTVGETTYQHTQVSSSEPRNVFEQPHVQTNFGASSSSYACHDDDVYRPQFDYPQPSTYGQSIYVFYTASYANDEEEAFAINLWNNRFDWLPEDCTPIEGNNFNCSPEYTEWFNNNGKPFLVAHEVSQRWHTEQRCSYQHVGETFEPEQNWHQSPNNGVMDLNIEWSTWESRTEPIRPVVGSSSSSNPWEEPIYNYPTVGETTYQHTQVSSSEPRNVFEQPHVQTNFGASSSSYACHDDDVYRPQFDYPQPSTYGQSMCVDSVTCWLSTTTISTPSFAQDMYSTPPPMQTMDDQLNQDEQTPDLLHQRRIVNPPRRYDQTSSLHRQVLPRRKG
ncbi:hypothetical protein V6N13_035944 [Hibiscus sabdariffa]